MLSVESLRDIIIELMLTFKGRIYILLRSAGHTNYHQEH